MMSTAFGTLPDTVLLPWLPRLITTLREHAAEVVPVLVREAGRTFPGTLRVLDSWTPPWQAAPTTAAIASAPPAGLSLLATHPASVDAVAALLGLDPTWPQTAPASGEGPATAFVARYPDSAEAIARLTAVA